MGPGSEKKWYGTYSGKPDGDWDKTAEILMLNFAEVANEPSPNEDLESMEIPSDLPIADPHTNAELQGNLLQEYEHKFEQLSEDQKLSKLCSDAGLKIFEKDNSS